MTIDRYQGQQAKYWNSVRDMVQYAKAAEAKNNGSGYDFLHKQVDGSDWIIYYRKNLNVLQATDNDNAYHDMGIVIDTNKGIVNALAQVAYWAMFQDCVDLYDNID